MSAPELVSGYVIAGKYAVRSLLLHGGPTATYRATGPKSREVAVKLYDPGILAFPDVLKGLAQHQSIGSKLSVDQVVPIVDSGTDANSGAPFTVTDFEQGPSLARLVDRGPLSAAQMVSLVRHLAAVTDLLHASGIASLSLHPGNVFVRPGSQYEVRVADFGSTLVRAAIPTPEKSGRWMPWLAPEQIKAQAPLTHGADLFALALMAFFAVTGKPYWRSSQLKTPDAAALRREILGERMPASVRAGEFGITLNPAVDAVFTRALAFRPGDRYATARDFAVALEAAVSGRPVAEVEATRQPSANVSSATVKADAGPAPQRASSSGEPASARMAPPPPRKMPLRATMVGMGNKPAEEPAASPAPGGARPKLNTMLGMGEPAAQAVAAAAAKAGPPPMPGAAAKIPAPGAPVEPAKYAAPAKVSPPPMPTAAAKPPPPAMPALVAAVGPAAPAAPAMQPQAAAPIAPMKPVAPAASTKAIVTPPAMPAPAAKAPAMSAQPGGPPPLPMEPPPAQLAAVLATFEASAKDLLPAANSPASPLVLSDGMQTPPAWSPAQPVDLGGERVETGVAIIGTGRVSAPKNTRMRWIAGAAALLLLTGGGAWALSGSSHGRTASDPKAAATTQAPLANAPAATPDPTPTQEPQAANAAHPAPEEPPSAPPEPVVAVPPPSPPEPVAAEPTPPPPEVHAAAQPASAPSRSNASSGWTPAPAAPRAQPPAKPCGKFLKRCK